MALKQEQRLLQLKTPLGEDVLVLNSFSGYEEMSGLFRYELEMISHNTSISAAQIVGKNVTFAVALPDGKPRYFNGFVRRFFAGDEDRQGRRNYRAKVVPWLWFLTRTTDCRIFQNKSVPEIIEQVFKDLGFSDYALQVKGEHPKWEYCVQYRESDFDFVSRLMEEEGIFYFFKHEAGKHSLVLADQTGAYTDVGESEVNYPRDAGTRAVADHLTRWEHSYEFRSGKCSHTDYNFEDHPARTESTPANLLMASQTSTVKLDNIEKYELYDYPGGYEKKDDGQAASKIRMEEDEAEHDVVHAASTCRTFTPGGKFKVKDHRSKSEEGKQYVITYIKHSATEPGAYETSATTSDEEYKNTFYCIPASVTFRPKQTTPKPAIQGSQTAVVVGPKGEEIWPDKYGRVKVQFHWDREGKRDEKSSCWVRCAQSSAGKGWGAMFIPRIGQEVVVSYLEGDPDRPLITGTVFNADQMPAYKLPDEKTKSYLKTNSKGGQGFNEIRLDDAQGKEQVFIHSQRDFDLIVGGNRQEVVAGNEDFTVGGDQVENVGRNMQLLVGGNQDVHVQKDKTETVEGECDLHVEKNRAEQVDGDQSLTVGGNQQEKIGGNHAVDVGNSIHLNAGANVVIEAGVQLTIKVGSSFVAIGPSGVSIQGTVVLINSGGAPGSGSGSSPTAPKKAHKAQPKQPKAPQSGQKSAPG